MSLQLLKKKNSDGFNFLRSLLRISSGGSEESCLAVASLSLPSHIRYLTKGDQAQPLH